MPYLTEEDYIAFTGEEPSDKFDALLDRASAELDTLTRFFYRYNELGTNMRDEQFKRAVAYQIQFYEEMGTTSVESYNSTPDSVHIGDTTVTNRATMASAQGSQRDSMISKDALNVLKGTGLLYRGARGVSVW